MNQSNLKPASSLAARYGCKSILYGQPGTGKTPMLNTAPRPVLLSVEPGLASMRTSKLPTFEAHSYKLIDEFFDWFLKSHEAKSFDTLAMDSGSQIAEIVLNEELKKHKDPRKAYGEMSRKCMEWFDGLFFMPQKHVVMICKMMRAEVGKQVVSQNGAFVVEMTYQSQPYFPGNDLNIKVPHRYDDILYVAKAQIPGQPQPVTAIRTVGTPEILARNRTGLLAEFEPPNLAALFSKSIGN